MRKLTVAALAAGVLGMCAPAAQAAEPASVGCGFDRIGDPMVVTTPEAFAVYGYVVADGVLSVTIRCAVRVDGVETDATATESGTVVAVVRDYVEIDASDSQSVELCAEWTAGSSSGEVCRDARPTQIPPQEVIDALDVVFDLLADSGPHFDPIFCAALQTAGAPAVVNLLAPAASMDADDCDLYLEDERWIDFVPYDD